MSSMTMIPTGRDYMSSRRQHILEIQDRIERAESADDYDDADQSRQELDDMALSVEIVKHVEIFLGVGGPTDWLDVELYSGGGIKSVTYSYAWGSESFSTTLSESDALYQYAANMVEYAAEGE